MFSLHLLIITFLTVFAVVDRFETTSYHGLMAALKKLEIFDGMEDVDRFIDRFEFAVTVDDVETNKQASQLALHLGGSAFDVWKGMTTDDKMDVSKIKEALRATYGLTRYAAWRKLTSYSVSGGQLDSAYENLHKWTRIVAAAGPDPVSAIATTAFVEALPVAIAQKVRVLCGQRASKQQVVAAAKDVWEDAGECSEGTKLTAAAFRRQRQDSVAPAKPVDRATVTQQRSSLKCSGCYQRGHLVDRCPTICFKCGYKGHIARRCTGMSGNEKGEPLLVLQAAPRD